MPAIRNTASLHCGHLSAVKLEQVVFQRTHPYKISPAAGKSPKKKTSNAFFLYRSHVLANKLLPTGITRQNDASREAAKLWKTETPQTRTRFFTLAEDVKRRHRAAEQQADISISPTPSLSHSYASSAIPSPPATPDSKISSTPPPAPRLRTRELPRTRSIVNLPQQAYTSDIWKEEVPPPNYESLIYTLSDEWYSPQSTSCLSLGCSYDYDTSALGLVGIRPL